MLAEPKLQQLYKLVEASAKEELIWINGYVSGAIASHRGGQENAPIAVQEKTIAMVYGTETGNAKKLAASLAATAREHGITVRLTSLEQYRLHSLSKEEFFFVIISTHGDGEPPDAARKFYDYIHQQAEGSCSSMHYSVLALGDTAYPLFCKAGEDVDAQLHRLGATRIAPLERCDVDYDEAARRWFSRVLHAVEGNAVAVPPAVSIKTTTAAKSVYTGTVLATVNLNGRGSNKRTQHIEIATEGVPYAPGDAIGIVPPNAQEVVAAVLALAGADAHARVAYRGTTHVLLELLQTTLSLTRVSERVVEQYAAFVQREIPRQRVDITELLAAYPLGTSRRFEDVIPFLEPITPRLYSIASSPTAHAGEIHLTVARHSFECDGAFYDGVCSQYLLHKNKGETIRFTLHRNNSFRLPVPSRDIIMIGPGTGIAPFRSFLAEREALGATGRNWLFFGEQHFASDFLYQTEIQAWAESSVLNKVHTAFSRDQEEKVYVQHRMKQHGAELFAWIEGGATVYVCGAKHPMSTDVDATLLDIVRQWGARSQEAAEEYLAQLKNEGRYVKDVY